MLSRLFRWLFAWAAVFVDLVLVLATIAALVLIFGLAGQVKRATLPDQRQFGVSTTGLDDGDRKSRRPEPPR